MHGKLVECNMANQSTYPAASRKTCRWASQEPSSLTWQPNDHKITFYVPRGSLSSCVQSDANRDGYPHGRLWSHPLDATPSGRMVATAAPQKLDLFSGIRKLTRNLFPLQPSLLWGEVCSRCWGQRLLSQPVSTQYNRWNTKSVNLHGNSGCLASLAVLSRDIEHPVIVWIQKSWT